MSRIREFSPKWRVVALVLLAFLVLLPAVFLSDSAPQDLDKRFAPPRLPFDLGADQMGRPLGTRLYFGLIRSLGVLSLTLASTLLIAIPAGLIAARLPRIARVMDTIGESVWSIPTFVIVLLIFTLLKGQWIPLKFFCLGIFNWVPTYRVVRDTARQIAPAGYVQFGRILGMGEGSVYWHIILPNLIAAIVPTILLGIVSLLELDFLLSFLGLSYPAPTPTVGGILRQGIEYLQFHMILFPCLLIVTIVIVLMLWARGWSRREISST